MQQSSNKAVNTDRTLALRISLVCVVLFCSSFSLVRHAIPTAGCMRTLRCPTGCPPTSMRETGIGSTLLTDINRTGLDMLLHRLYNTDIHRETNYGIRQKWIIQNVLSISP